MTACRVRVAGVLGFGLAELLVALAVSLGALAAVGVLAGAALDAVRTQPEAADVQQRVRLALAALGQHVENAGQGAQTGSGAGHLVLRVPAIFPSARVRGGDPDTSAFDDRLTVLRVPPDGVTVALASAMAGQSGPLQLAASAGCPIERPACRFAQGDEVLVFDDTGSFDVLTVRAVTADTLEPSAALSRVYGPDHAAAVLPIELRALDFDAATRQVRATRVAGRALPVVDDVVGVRFRLWGDPEPPDQPRPLPGDANCLFDTTGATRLARLAATWGALADLPPSALRDGPWCGTAPNRYDADLFRVRRVRITVRLQVRPATLRGADPVLFRHPGSATRPGLSVADHEVSLDVAPPNLPVQAP